MSALTIVLSIILVSLTKAAKVSVTGVLVDIWCWDTNNFIAFDTKADLRIDAPNHSTKCMYDLDFCRNGGYGLLNMNQNTSMYELTYYLDSNGNTIIENMLMNIGSIERRGQIKNYNVMVYGEPINNTLMVENVTLVSADVYVTGTLVDLWCWEVNNFTAFDTKTDLRYNSGDHSAKCMYDLEFCRNGGFGILVYEMGLGMYNLHYKFDSYTADMIISQLMSIGTTEDRAKIKNYEIMVMGTIDKDYTLTASTIKYPIFRGILVDLWCWDINNFTAFDTKSDLRTDGPNHSTKCMYDLEFCRNGGFAVLEWNMNTNMYQIKYRFDEKGNNITKYLLKDIGSTERRASIKNYVVNVYGTEIDSNNVMVDSITLSTADVTVTGFLIDLWCWYDNNFIAFDSKADLRYDAGNHSAKCMYDLEFCRNSGFGIAVMESATMMYNLDFIFDKMGNNMVVSQLESLGTTDDRAKIKNYEITVMGTINGGNDRIIYVNDITFPTPAPAPIPTNNAYKYSITPINICLFLLFVCLIF